MALTARLQFGDNVAGLYSREYLIADCHLHFNRHHNHFKPDTDARCETMELVVVAPGREDLNLYEWYINNDTLSGRVVIVLLTMSENDSVMKFVEFEGVVIDIPLVKVQVFPTGCYHHQFHRFTPRVGVGFEVVVVPLKMQMTICYQVLFGIKTCQVIAKLKACC